MIKKTVSIVIPCFNEEAFIGKVLDNILAQDYPLDEIEVFVCDGGSTDETRSIVKQYELRYNEIELLDNPDKYVPHAINRAIKVSKGDFIFLFGAHTLYPNNYISTLKSWAERLDADLVGGALDTKPRSDTPTAKGIANVLSHPLGIGNATFRTGTQKVMAVDTVPFGCYRKTAFERYGVFDERLIRNQDMEMSKRILNGGGKIYLIPGIRSTYYGRDTIEGLWKNNFGNGRWVLLTAKYTKRFKSLSIRHFVPLFFVLYLISLLPCYFLLRDSFYAIYSIPAFMYFISIFVVSLWISIRERDFSLFIPSFISFTSLHLSYGLGSLRGMVDVLTK